MSAANQPQGADSRMLRWLGKATTAFARGVTLLGAAGLAVLGVNALRDVPIKYVFAAFGLVAAAFASGLVYDRASAMPRSSTTQVRARWGVLTLLGLGLAVFGLEVANAARAPAANHPAGSLVVIALAALAGLGLLMLAERLGHGSEGNGLLVTAAVLVGSATFGVWLGYGDRTSGTLHDYCSYGAVSGAQLRGCLDHVPTDRISHLDTDAARFAVGGLDACLGDAGPYCADALTQRQSDEDQ